MLTGMLGFGKTLGREVLKYAKPLAKEAFKAILVSGVGDAISWVKDKLTSGSKVESQSPSDVIGDKSDGPGAVMGDKGVTPATPEAEPYPSSIPPTVMQALQPQYQPSGMRSGQQYYTSDRQLMTVPNSSGNINVNSYDPQPYLEEDYGYGNANEEENWEDQEDEEGYYQPPLKRFKNNYQ